jgi:hypothetical protein
MSFEKSGIPSISEGHMAAPALLILIDYTVFQQSANQKGEAYSAKVHHREELRTFYGNKWKKHLNVPSRKLDNPVKMTF